MSEDNEPKIVVHQGLFSSDALGEFSLRDNSIHIVDKDVLYNVVLEHEKEHWNHRQRKYMRLLQLCSGRRNASWVIAWILLGVFLAVVFNETWFQVGCLAIAAIPMFVLEFEEYTTQRTIYRKFKEQPTKEKPFNERILNFFAWIKEKKES